MDIFISNIDNVATSCYRYKITHVISLLRGDMFNEVVLPPGFPKSTCWLRLDMDDVIDPNYQHAPKLEQIIHILDWTARLPKDSNVLVHCIAGIGRSPAVALMLKTRELGVDRVDDAVKWLVEHRPIASPNPVITKYADQLLGADGKLYAEAERVAMSKLMLLYNNDENIALGMRNNQTN